MFVSFISMHFNTLIPMVMPAPPVLFSQTPETVQVHFQL